jgi:hypothetical protein
MVQGQRCPRQRWWGYDFQWRGVAPKKYPIPLFTGLWTHEAIGLVLDAHRETNRDSDDAAQEALVPRQEVRDIIAMVKAKAGEMLLERGLDVDNPPTVQDDTDPDDAATEYEVEQFRVSQEQLGLMEGMVWAYWHYAYPLLVKDYEIVEVEIEEPPQQLTATDLTTVFMQGRTDAVLRSRYDGKLYAYSLKTAKGWDIRKSNEGEVDMQGLTEPWLMEKRLGEPIAGVKMEYIIKGERKRDSKGWMTQYSPLIRGWIDINTTMKESTIPQGVDVTDLVMAGAISEDYGENPLGKSVYWRWEYTDIEKQKSKRLHYRNQEPLLVWGDMSPFSIEEWVDMLARGEIQPEAEESADALSTQFVLPPPYRRSQAKLDSWETRASFEEHRLARGRELVNISIEKGLYEEASLQLDRYYPMYTHSCNYPTKCKYWNLCHRSSEPAAMVDPIVTGDFVWRQPHHEGEIEEFTKLAGGEL